MINVDPKTLWWLDLSGLILNFLGGLLLAYDLLTETRKAVAEQEGNKLETKKEIHEISVRSYTQSLDRQDLPETLRAMYQAELDKENAAYKDFESKLKKRMEHLEGHGDRAVTLGFLGIIIITIGFLLQLIKILLS